MMYRITFLMILFLPFLAKTNASTVPNWTNKNIVSTYPIMAKDTLSPLQTEEVQKIEKTMLKKSRVSFGSGWLSVICTVLFYLLAQTVTVSMAGFVLALPLIAFIAALVAILSGLSFTSVKRKYPNITFRNDLTGVGIILAILSIASYIIPILLVLF